MRQTLYTLLYREYRQDPLRHSVPLGLLTLNALVQKVFGINRRCRWPVHYTSRITYPERVQAGAEAKLSLAVNGGIYLQGKNGVSIGESTIIASGTKIVSANHEDNALGKHSDSGPVAIGHRCWLGANSVVLPGVKVGDDTTIAAGAVVTKSPETPGGVLRGVPAIRSH